MTELFSILVTTTGRPQLGSRHVLRHGGGFLVGEVRSTMPGPPSSMPSWSVIWRVDPTVDEALADAMARNSYTFALDARATPEEALEWHSIDEVHWREHGYAPNHWT